MEKTRAEIIKKVLAKYQSPKFVEKQINEAVYKQGKNSFEELSNISKDIRADLKELWDPINSLKLVNSQEGNQSSKYLFETRDGYRIESVIMKYLPNEQRKEEHTAICLSSQSGCALGCKFCATGAIGFNRDLTEDELIDQIRYFSLETKNKTTIDSVFFSGMGEPLANPELFPTLKVLTAPDGMGFSSRRVSISTVGIIPGIQRLTKEYPQINLAFSLHSPFNDQRSQLMPITKAYSIQDVFKVLKEHVEQTNRKVFIAYTLLKGVNDSREHSKKLIELIKETGDKAYLFHVNLIRYHKGPSEVKFEEPDERTIGYFREALERRKIPVTIRKDFGLDIEGACGQLYAKYQKKRNKST